MRLTNDRSIRNGFDPGSSDQNDNASQSSDDSTMVNALISPLPVLSGIGTISLAGDGIHVLAMNTGQDGVTTQSVAFSGSGVVFNNIYTGNVSQAYENCIITAEQTLASTWTNSVTVTEEFDAQAEGRNGELASNEFWVYDVSYATLKSALTSLASEESNNTYLQQAVAHLPGTDPSGGAGFELSLAYARMLGLTAQTESYDDEVVLNTSYNWSYGQDVINTVEHEISEGGMGRVGGLGDQNSSWSIMDLFRYNSSGQADYTDGRDGQMTYFSYNGGATLSSSAGLTFNNEYSGNTRVNSGDTADFIQQDVFGTGNTGETNTLSQTDLEIMDALGWNPTGSTNSVPLQDGWNIIAGGDFTNNGITDILWQEGNQVGVWLENSGLNPTWALLTSNTAGWAVVGTSDYNGDGYSDILWSNGNELGVWLENSSLNPTWKLLATNSAGWSVIGSGDFNDDGTADILWRNGNQVGVWLENSSLNPTWKLLSANTNGWSVVGTGDYTGSGYRDILWSNGSEFGVWLENGSLNPTWELLSTNINGWSVVGSGDYNGATNNGHPVDDILWYNANAQELGVWVENGSLNPTWKLLSANTNGWFVIGSGDYNGDGVSDILWSNGSETGVWLENSSLNPTWQQLTKSG